MNFEEFLFAAAVWGAVGVPYGLLLVNMPTPENKIEQLFHFGLSAVGLILLTPILIVVFLFGVMMGIFGIGGKNDS